ncbi:MAG: preprotein translocase subunit SecY, partial [Acidobacteria bacterium]
MIESLQNIFRIEDLRRRVLFTLGLLAVYRVGKYIPLPGIDASALQEWFASNAGGVFGMVDVFTGGNFSKMTIFGLGIMPYISASIILQLLAVVWPYLERLQKEGEVGRRKITQYTRYGTVILSALQSFGIAFWVSNLPVASTGPIVPDPGP